LNPLHSFGFLIRDTSDRYVERFEQRAAAVGLGLTQPQSKTLLYLAGREGVSQAQLANLTNLEPMTLMRTLDYLERRELLERRNHPTDRRTYRLYLKPKGAALVDDIWHLIDSIRREIFAGIPKKHVDLMIELLEKTHNNIVSLESPPPMLNTPTLPDGPVSGDTVQRRRKRATSR